MIRSLVLAGLLALALVAPAAAQSVTPRACAVTTVTTGGTAVTALTGPANGYTITNPLTTTDEGIGSVEPLYVDPTAAATTTANGTVSALAAGASFTGIPNSSGSVSINAATSGHKFTCVRW